MYEACIGKYSSKQANKERRKLVDKIRAEISERHLKAGEPGVVTEKELTKAVHQSVLDAYKEKRNRHVLQDTFAVFRYLYEYSKSCDKKARALFFKKVVGKTFRGWSEWTYVVGVGLDRRRWSGPRKYEVCTFAQHGGEPKGTNTLRANTH